MRKHTGNAFPITESSSISKVISNENCNYAEWLISAYQSSTLICSAKSFLTPSHNNIRQKYFSSNCNFSHCWISISIWCLYWCSAEICANRTSWKTNLKRKYFYRWYYRNATWVFVCLPSSPELLKPLAITSAAQLKSFNFSLR